MYKIPLFDLNFDKQEEDAVIETIKTKWISTGPKCEEFENEFAQAFDANFALSLTNCTAALHLALEVLGITKGDEVIVPSLTFAATANCVKYVKADPVFADITSLKDLTISPEEIKSKITPRTKAIIVMHFAGFPCDMEAIMEIAKNNNLFVIEDACHSPLSEYKNKKLGNFGDISCYSFFSNKNMSTGEGGMMLFNEETLYNKAKLLRSHGMTTMSYQRATGHATKYDINEIGFNYRMDDIRASIGIVQLNKLKSDLNKRQNVREKYEKNLNQINRIIVPFKNNEEFVSNYIMPIVLKDSNEEERDNIRKKLHERGIQTSVHYPSVHKFSCYSDDVSLPITEYVSSNMITLPMYGNLKEKDVLYICESLKEILS